MSRGDRGDDPERISVLVRNLPLDTRAEEVRAKFEKYGRVKDVYLPRDFYSGRPKGFGFVAFTDRRDADDAIYHLDRTMFAGREITVCYSKEGRKTPREMSDRDARMGVAPRMGRRRSASPRRRRSYSRSRSRGRRRSYSRSRSRDRRRSYSRSRSPARRSRSPRRRSRSLSRSRSPARRRSPSRSRSRSRSPARSRSRSPARSRSRSPARSPARSRSRSPARSRSKSRSRSPAKSPERSPAPADD